MNKNDSSILRVLKITSERVDRGSVSEYWRECMFFLFPQTRFWSADTNKSAFLLANCNGSLSCIQNNCGN